MSGSRDPRDDPRGPIRGPPMGAWGRRPDPSPRRRDFSPPRYVYGRILAARSFNVMNHTSSTLNNCMRKFLIVLPLSHKNNKWN